MENKENNIIMDKVRDALAKYGLAADRMETDEAPRYDIVKAYIGDRVGRKTMQSLSDDLATSLGLAGIRCTPFSEGLSFELPKSKEETSFPRFCYAVRTPGWSDGKELPVFLGYGERYAPVILDLVDAPHLLVAGAVKQGKSVCLRSIIDSLLCTKKPGEVKFFIGDPKMVEFSDYENLDRSAFWDEGIVKYEPVFPHLERLCSEMDRRYDILSRKRCCNISEYNKDHEDMPYIVVVIDEYADYMSDYGHEREFVNALVRLAQKGMAVGIHCVILTQRPDTRFISGIIKANFPTRLAFRCTRRVDSCTILDEEGAEKLLGKGDMLLANGCSLVRLQGLYEDGAGTAEAIRRFNGQIQQITTLRDWQEERETVTKRPVSFSNSPSICTDDDFFKAARLVVSEGLAAVSFIQRNLGWGYNKASQMMDLLQETGIVGPLQNDHTREVLVKSPDELERLLDGMKEK